MSPNVPDRPEVSVARNNPPAALITGPGVRVTLQYQTDNNTQQNSIAYNLGSSVVPTLLDLQNFTTAWNTTNLAPLQGTQTVNTTFFQLLVTEVWYGLTPTYVATYTGGTTGSVTGGVYPLEVAVSAVWRTSLKGQHGRGRIQFPNVPLSFVTPGTDPNSLNAAGISAYLSALAALNTSITTSLGIWFPVVIQRAIPPAVLSQRATQIASSTLNHVLGTQRRRKLGRGI